MHFCRTILGRTTVPGTDEPAFVQHKDRTPIVPKKRKRKNKKKKKKEEKEDEEEDGEEDGRSMKLTLEMVE